MAQRATSLGPKPSLFIFLFFFSFLCLFFICFLIGNPVFPPKKGNFRLFICVSLLFLFSLVLASPFFFPFSFFVSLLLFSFFLPSCFFHLSFWFFLFLVVWFASWFKMLCCFSFSACCLLVCILWSFFLFCFFVVLF